MQKPLTQPSATCLGRHTFKNTTKLLFALSSALYRSDKYSVYLTCHATKAYFIHRMRSHMGEGTAMTVTTDQ